MSSFLGVTMTQEVGQIICRVHIETSLSETLNLKLPPRLEKWLLYTFISVLMKVYSYNNLRFVIQFKGTMEYIYIKVYLNSIKKYIIINYSKNNLQSMSDSFFLLLDGIC